MHKGTVYAIALTKKNVFGLVQKSTGFSIGHVFRTLAPLALLKSGGQRNPGTGVVDCRLARDARDFGLADGALDSTNKLFRTIFLRILGSRNKKTLETNRRSESQVSNNFLSKSPIETYRPNHAMCFTCHPIPRFLSHGFPLLGAHQDVGDQSSAGSEFLSTNGAKSFLVFHPLVMTIQLDYIF